MNLRNETADGKIKTGCMVLVRSAANEFPYWDVVRGVFTQDVLLQPYAPNEQIESLVLTNRSWCPVTDVLLVKEGGNW